MREPPLVEEPRLRSVCLFGQGAKCCTYLGMMDGFRCLKHSEFHALLTARREAGTIRAMGDNCPGPPLPEATA